MSVVWGIAIVVVFLLLVVFLCVISERAGVRAPSVGLVSISAEHVRFLVDHNLAVRV
jgi:hypothetical protein